MAQTYAFRSAAHIGNMINRGVLRDTIKVGDEIVISVNPLHNGQTGGNYTRIVSINAVENTAEGSAWDSESAEGRTADGSQATERAPGISRATYDISGKAARDDRVGVAGSIGDYR